MAKTDRLRHERPTFEDKRIPALRKEQARWMLTDEEVRQILDPKPGTYDSEGCLVIA